MLVETRTKVAVSGTFALLTIVALTQAVTAADWPRFRGPNGSGISGDAEPTPTTWTNTKNLRWSVDLPGRGVSSPIVVGDRVIVTSWTGDGPDNLVRHLSCFDRATGKRLLDKAIEPTVKDEPYENMFRQVGYAASTPTSDGEHIYCFFGVSGVYAFDMQGNQLWHTSVGTNFDENGWGTASSPILWNDLVIVTAAAESNSLIALRKSDGQEAWKYESKQFDGTWSTPVIVDLPDGRQKIVVSVPGFVWAFDPATGKQNWTCQTYPSNSAIASPIAHGDVVYAIGGREGGGLAIRAGGSGDVTETNVVWSGNQRARIGTPIYDDGLIYWVADGMANCIDADTGERVYQQRLQPQPEVARTGGVFHLVAEESPAAPANDNPPPTTDQPGAAQPNGPGPGQGGPGGRGRGYGRRGRGGGGFLQQDYSSPIAADGKIYFTRRNGEVYVFALGREFKQLAVSKFDGEADYSATPAISAGDIFIRSSKKLYCIGGE